MSFLALHKLRYCWRLLRRKGLKTMPFMICGYADPLDAATRERVAKSITHATHDVIGSPLDLINVVLRQPDRNQIWLAGEQSDVAIILCFIRAGRSQARRTELALRMSKAWHEAVGTPEASIEVAVFETPGGERSQTSRDRLRTELAILSQLGPALMTIQGWAAPAVGEVLERATNVARQLKGRANLR